MSELRTGTNLVRNARMVGQTLVAEVHGEIDLNNSPEIRRALFDLVARHAPTRVVLNVSDVTYMDSSAIAVLVELLRKLGKPPGKLFLAGCHPRVKGLLEIARLNTIFNLVDSEAEALGGK